ncbi:MAG: hypothetical protein JEZ06_21250 [Anaerolineaceae bacterium]|nr:hypothetical protein [Anaerolineaceae bacterium]
MESNQNPDRDKRFFNSMVRFFFILGLIDLAAGVLHIGALVSGITEAPIIDALFNIYIGVSYLLCGLILRNRNPAVMIIFAIHIIALIVYAPLQGRAPSYFIVIICGIIYFYLFKFWRSGELENDPNKEFKSE